MINKYKYENLLIDFECKKFFFEEINKNVFGNL